IDAATGMVSLRNALRGLAATGAGPAQLLTWLPARFPPVSGRVRKNPAVVAGGGCHLGVPSGVMPSLSPRSP
ncbi:hypothetical protein, partial [Amycolatopsis sp. NPDC003731]